MYYNVKKNIFKCMFLILTVFLVMGSLCFTEVKAEALDTDIVTFPDPNLEAAVREKLVKPTGDITVGDMKKMTELNASSKGIKDLTGLQYAVNITVLDLEYNQITDITPLSNMSSLKILILNYNQITDITPLQDLQNLWMLCLSHNQISDISALKELKKIAQLSLNNNQISDISSLSNMDMLLSLIVSNNKIKDISPLESLTWLKVALFKNNEIQNIEPLKKAFGLIILDLRNNKIKGSIPSEFSSFSELNTVTEEANENFISIFGVDAQTSFEGNQLVGVVPDTLKSKLGEKSFESNLFEDAVEQKQLSLKEGASINIPLSSEVTLNTLKNLTYLGFEDEYESCLYEVELVPVEEGYFDATDYSPLLKARGFLMYRGMSISISFEIINFQF